MQALSAAALLDVWELARGSTLPRRALTLLAAADPAMPYPDLASLPVGERDARLLALRERAFGCDARGVATCPACSEPVEMTFATDGLRAQTASRAQFTVATDEGELVVRVPCAEDLVAAAAMPDEAGARRLLIERCLGRTLDNLPAHLAETVIAGMAECDPGASIELSLACPQCHHHWLAVFDIVTFFWAEIDTWARRLLGDVHALAGAYGWTEADVLALSPGRRQFYVEMSQ